MLKIFLSAEREEKKQAGEVIKDRWLMNGAGKSVLCIPVTPPPKWGEHRWQAAAYKG